MTRSQAETRLFQLEQQARRRTLQEFMEAGAEHRLNERETALYADMQELRYLLGKDTD